MPDINNLDVDQPDQLPTQDPTLAQTTPLDNSQAPSSTSTPINTDVTVPEGGFKNFKLKDWIGTGILIVLVLGIMAYAAINLSDTAEVYKITMKDGTVEMCKWVQVTPCGMTIDGCQSGHKYTCNTTATVPPEAIKNFK